MLRSLFLTAIFLACSLCPKCQNVVGMELALFIGIEVETPQTTAATTDTSLFIRQDSIKLVAPFADEDALKKEFYLQNEIVTTATRKEEIVQIIPFCKNYKKNLPHPRQVYPLTK